MVVLQTTAKLMVVIDDAKYVLDGNFEGGDKKILGSISAEHNKNKMASLDLSVDTSVKNGARKN